MLPYGRDTMSNRPDYSFRNRDYAKTREVKSYSWDAPAPKHVAATERPVKYTERSFTVAVAGSSGPMSPWRDCLYCLKSCLGDESLARHVLEKHPCPLCRAGVPHPQCSPAEAGAPHPTQALDPPVLSGAEVNSVIFDENSD